MSGWLIDVDEWARDATGVWWLSVVGLMEHQLVGLTLWLLLYVLGAPGIACYVACLAAGVIHEWTQARDGGSDFATRNGGPINGTLDVLAFAPLGPMILALVL